VGTWLQIIADLEVSQDEAGELAQKVLKWLVSREIVEAAPIKPFHESDEDGYPPGANAKSALDDPKVQERLYPGNTVLITLGRTVFHTYQGGFSLICEKCGAHNEDGESWHDAVGEWYDDRGPGILACETCGHSLPITQWQFDPPWGFGFLGFTFYDWPTLDQAFIDEITALLGHKTVYIYTKL